MTLTSAVSMSNRSGKHAGCTVEFLQRFWRPDFFVDFDRKGKIQKVRSGIVMEKHGPP